tara:strand:- start:400 stop:1356 length:957 start_codon:yes stop_codon:yes gene_type:complete
MKESVKIPNIIDKANSQNLTHIFLTVSPVTSLIYRMIVEKYSIDKNKIKVFSFRNTDTSIINYCVKKIKSKRYYRILEKFLWDSPNGRKISYSIGQNDYIVYCSWAFREANWLINNKKCKGHIYIEEGQHSYMNISSYDPTNISLTNKIKKNWKNRFSNIDEYGYYFRNDADAFIGLNNDIFPNISKTKKYYLDNLNEMKKYYKPKLLGISKIGLSCATRRVKEENWEEMLQKLFGYVGAGGAIKAHPSFSVSQQLRSKFKRTFDKLNTKNYFLCSDEIILELEMLFEPKILFGPQTSLSKYAKLLGSEFIDIKLYSE